MKLNKNTKNDANENATGPAETAPVAKKRRGAIAVLTAFLMIPLMSFAALAVDMGYAYVVQSELQVAADAAALAAAGEMSRSTSEVYKQKAKETAIEYVALHKSLGMSGNLKLATGDIEFGNATLDSNTTKWTFAPDNTAAAPYAIRVTVRRDGKSNPLVPRFFSKIFGASDGVQSATASAMLAPRDIALVVDRSQSMTFDSMFLRRNSTQVNMRDVWVTLNGTASSPSTKFVNGVEYITEYELLTPSTSVYANDDGPTFGSMTEWGDEILQGQYNENALDNYELPQRSYCPSGGWTTTLGGTNDPRYKWLVTSLTNPKSLKSRGHSNTQINNLLRRPSSSESSSTYRARVKVILGLATWNDGGNNYVSSREVNTNVTEPFAKGANWDTWINDVRNKNGLTYLTAYGGASYFRHRYGLKTYVNWLMDRQFTKTGPVSGSSGYTPMLQQAVAEPLQSVKDAILAFSQYLKDVESNDNVGLVVYGTNGVIDPFSSTNGLTNDFEKLGELPYPHQAGENGRYTNTAQPLIEGFKMIHGPGSRAYAHKVIVFMSDGYTTADNHYSVMSDLTSETNIAKLNDVSSMSDFESLFGGSSVTTGGSSSSDGREETLGIAKILASNLLGVGDVEFNVVGVGSNADIQNLPQPIAQMSGGDAYHAVPDVNDPAAMAKALKKIYTEIGGRRSVALIHPGN